MYNENFYEGKDRIMSNGNVILYEKNDDDGLYYKKNGSFLAFFWFFNKMLFYTSFSKKIPVSGKEVDLNHKEKRNLLLLLRFWVGCFVLMVILLGFGIPLLCLNILFKLAVAMTAVGAVCLVIHLALTTLMSYFPAIGCQSEENDYVSLGPQDIPKGYQLGDTIIPIIESKKEEKSEDKI